MAGLWDITNAVSRSLEEAQAGVEELLFEPVIRLGVTGLSRAGKTVFITSLVANLMARERMIGLRAEAEGRLLTGFLQPQPNDTVARFAFEDHLAAITGPEPYWPEGTRAVSQLRLSLKVRPEGVFSSFRGPRTVHLDIIDYPGEWLLDLPLLDQTYESWSAEALALARSIARASLAAGWLDEMGGTDPAAPLDEVVARAQADAFSAYLKSAKAAGFSSVGPGRFLMPGELEGSPALTFAPLERPARVKSTALYAAFERRFEAYKKRVVKPFYQEHFAGIDRQIVLLDVLGAIHAGPGSVEDLRGAMAGILRSFRPGRNSWLASILGKRVEKILFAATKADHLHHSQHGALTDITSALVEDARRQADFKGAKTEAMSIASVRATVEEMKRHGGSEIGCVRGRLLGDGREVALYPGALPADPAQLLIPARQGADAWLEAEYNVMQFAPPEGGGSAGAGPAHIRLDRAAEFLIGDRLT